MEDESSPRPFELKFLLSTGEVPYSYEIVDLVFGFDSSSEGFLTSINSEDAYRQACQLLKLQASELGANAVINIRFETRVAHKGNISEAQVFEVFASGTAVRSIDDAWSKK